MEPASTFSPSILTLWLLFYFFLLPISSTGQSAPLYLSLCFGGFSFLLLFGPGGDGLVVEWCLATTKVIGSSTLGHRSPRCFSDMTSYAGVNYSSPTLSTAMLNLVPGFAFILAVIFRLEEVNLRRLGTIAKSLGTIVSISGAFIITLYSGPAILNKPLTSGPLTQFYFSSTQNWVLGGFLLACAAFAVASWCILQAFILKMYPAEMIVVAFYCLFVTIQSSVVTLIAERDASAWRIDTKIGLIAILYSAIINIACRLYVTAWCIWKKGPFFVALFKPLTIVVTVVVGVIFMKEALYLGSLIGALVLVVGFYAVIWGKSQEGKINNKTESSKSNYEALLLDENVEEV